MFPTEALSIRSFKNLFIGQAVSQFGDAFYYVIFMFMVRQITGSTAMVGFVGAAETLPFLLVGGYAGVLADRLDRRKIMLISDLSSAACLIAFGILIYLDASPPAWTMVVTPFLMSCVRVFFMPAKSAAIPRLVPDNMLMKANALSNLAQTFMPLIGLALSASVMGALYAASKTWFFVTAVLVNTCSFLFSAAYIWLLPKLVPERHDEDKHPLQEFRQGLGYIKRHGVLRVYVFVSLFMNLMISPFFVVYVEANKQWYGGTPQILCVMEMSFFVGLVISSMFVGRFNIRRAGLGYSYSLGTVGLAVAAMAFCKTIWLYSIFNIIAGLAVPFCDIPLTTYIQTEVEDSLMGRVNSVLNMVRMGVMPIGMMLGGWMILKIGLSGAYLVMGFGMTAASLVALASPAFRGATIKVQAPAEAVVESEDALTLV
ncbi:MAG TPA: MFS transporter [Fimbriimonadaceae bacterium]|jgi:DHA3 family macrolide efflux protein-like MFS transporter